MRPQELGGTEDSAGPRERQGQETKTRMLGEKSGSGGHVVKSQLRGPPSSKGGNGKGGKSEGRRETVQGHMKTWSGKGRSSFCKQL